MTESGLGFTQISDWDAAYSNRAAVPDHEAHFSAWGCDALAFRQSSPGARLDIHYGKSAREEYDLFPAQLREGVERKGVMIFIHGGYWMYFAKSWFSHLAKGPTARGWDVAVISYPLAPVAHLGRIAEAVRMAIEAIARDHSGHIAIVGHSAGAQLAALTLCQERGLSEAILMRIERLTLISGVHDLRPLLHTSYNDTLELDLREAEHLSPALLTPPEEIETVVWVGQDELPEFRRQSRILADVWTGLGARVAHHEAPGRHHFSVIEDLTDPDSALCAAAAP